MNRVKLRAQYFCDDCDSHWYTVWNKPANKTHLEELRDSCPDCATWGSNASFYPLTTQRLEPEKSKAK